MPSRTADLNVVWYFQNAAGQRLELTYKVGEQLYSGRVLIAHAVGEANFRNLTRHETALVAETLPEGHKLKVKEWTDELWRTVAPYGMGG